MSGYAEEYSNDYHDSELTRYDFQVARNNLITELEKLGDLRIKVGDLNAQAFDPAVEYYVEAFNLQKKVVEGWRKAYDKNKDKMEAK